jgi:hypothetical protein
MKNFVRSGSVLLALLCCELGTRRANATVVWTANFEKNKSGDVCGSNNPGAEFTPGAIVVENGRIDAEVLGEQVYSGNLACKVTVHPDDIFGQYKQDRVDVKHNSTLTGEGKDMYLSGYYYLLADAQTRDEFGMFETTNSLNWVDIWVEPKTGGGTSIKLGIESNGANLGSVLIWTGDFTPGKWHQLAIHIHWSQDATQGLVDFWLDGQQVVTGFKHKTKPNANDLYYLTGLHRVLMQPYTESIYFDDFTEADTQGDIKIGAPMPGGGSSDGGGADGYAPPLDGGAAATDGAALASPEGGASTTGAMSSTGSSGATASSSTTGNGSGGSDAGSATTRGSGIATGTGSASGMPASTGSGGNAGATGQGNSSSNGCTVSQQRASNGLPACLFVSMGVALSWQRRRKRRRQPPIAPGTRT